jgi:hypothetical protein
MFDMHIFLVCFKKRIWEGQTCVIFQENEEQTFNQVNIFFITNSCEFVIHFYSFFVTIMVHFINLLIICKLCRCVIIYTWKKRAFFEIWNSRTPYLFNWLWTYFCKEIEHGDGCLPCKRQKTQWGITNNNWRR